MVLENNFNLFFAHLYFDPTRRKQLPRYHKHVTTLNRESRQQLDVFFPLVLADY